ncbi:hypothetical protein BGZ79_010608 [Entomortierella chlamydospora]|nr:hypothetical protein BGZ79_010608 [Entomortierella chlamydospora]
MASTPLDLETETRLPCVHCGSQFSSQKQLTTHKSEYHCKTCMVQAIDSKGTKLSLTVHRINGYLECPKCTERFDTRTDIRRHVSETCCSSESEEPDDFEDNNLPIVVPKEFPLPTIPVRSPIPQKRSVEELTATACKKSGSTAHDKKTTVLLMDHLEMVPVTFQSRSGEKVALIHLTELSDIPADEQFTVSVDPSLILRFQEADTVRNSMPVPVAGLEYVMSLSPYKSKIRRRKFIEMEQKFSELLNTDWVVRPQLRFVCPKIPAGSILLNTRNGEAVIVNCIEGYGRKKMIDAHHEPFLIKKGVATMTSLPPSEETRYRNVWPLTMNSADGEKMVVGTKSFNGLVTSSLRLDKVDSPSLGGTTLSFMLNDSTDSQATKIFLDEESVHEALEIANDSNAWCVSKEDALEQLRQVRSKFDSASTYFLCRASGSITNEHNMMPYTVFTLANSDSLQKGSGYGAAVLFNTIGENVIRHGSEATLTKKNVESSLKLCGTEGKIVEILNNIKKLFEDGETIEILNNTAQR